ncbi:MAG TPA: FHA domain-containing protein [Yinghuangia sp.]|uniref:FHA domain-containing protein n=1 Tax=Yinghuangia sp. YIM S10712 TaxID=3436930 RepID=UPI002C6269C8|nr:FHA domain-containing protein [Yinghuangia sp.]
MLDLNMASTSGADDAATVAMLMANSPSHSGAALAVGRDAARCHLVTPADWLFVSRMHLEFRCDDAGTWFVTWLRGSQDAPVAEVWLDDGVRRPLPYGGSLPLPRPGSGEVVIADRGGQRRVTVGWFLTVD